MRIHSALESKARALLLAGALFLPACTPGTSSCHGETSPCLVLDEAQCAADTSGACAWGPACSASCLGTDTTQCPATGPQGACYLSYTQECVPRVGNACAGLAQTECGAAKACRWGELCTGEVPCTSLHDESTCNHHLQCSWQVDSP